MKEKNIKIFYFDSILYKVTYNLNSYNFPFALKHKVTYILHTIRYTKKIYTFKKE